MKNTIFILTGKRNCGIFRRNDIKRFDEIKDQILVREFVSAREFRKFKDNIAEEIEEKDFVVLTSKQVAYIMDHAPSNQEYVERNIRVGRKK